MSINIISPVTSARDKIINQPYIVQRILRFRYGELRYHYSCLNMNMNMSKIALPLVRSVRLDRPRMMYDLLLAIIISQLL